jgi:general secretion pathway protein F
MARYSYEALNSEGAVLNGVLSAESEREAMRMLERNGMAPLRVREHVAGTRRMFWSRQRKPTAIELSVPLFELCTMLRSGVPLVDAVQAQSEAQHHPQVTVAFAAMAQGLKRGQKFSDVLANSGLELPRYMTQLARAGEMTGRLGDTLAGGVAQMEYEHRMRNEMRSALIYPTILIVAGIAAVLVMFAYVVPKFSTLLHKGKHIPLLGWMVLAGGTWFNANSGWLVPVALVAVVVVVLSLRTPKTRQRVLDRLGRLPVIGTWLLQAETGRWAKMMSELLQARVPLMDALDLARDGVGLSRQRLRMGEVARAVRAGKPLSEALETQDALTGTGYNLVRVGERSGQLPAMLSSLAQLYDEAARQRMKQVLALIEPVSILVIGVLVGLIIMGVMLAITSSYNISV